MKRLIPLALLLASAGALAQTATLAAPEVPPSRTYLLVAAVSEQRADPNDPNTTARVSVTLWKMTAGGVRAPDAESLRVDLDKPAEINGFLAAIETPIAGEPAGTTLGARSRRHNGRILNFLVTNCAVLTSCAAQIGAATMVP